MTGLRRRLTYANVMATLAVFIAIGGSATAAALITGRNVKNGTLTGKDVKNSSLGSADVKDGGLLAKDFRAGQLPAGAQGLQGPQGVKGDKGDPGAPGANGATNLVVRTEVFNVGGSAEITVDCNAGERAVGGGVSYSDGAAGGGSKVTQSAPALRSGGGIAKSGDIPTAWALGFDGNGVSQPVTFSAVCASP